VHSVVSVVAKHSAKKILELVQPAAANRGAVTKLKHVVQDLGQIVAKGAQEIAHDALGNESQLQFAAVKAVESHSYRLFPSLLGMFSRCCLIGSF
jgi:hypothetical protein